MYDRFTDKARLLLQQTYAVSQRLGHDFVHPEHILLGLLESPATLARTILTGGNADIAALCRSLEEQLRSPTYDGPSRPRGGKRIMEGAIEEARRHGHDWVGTEHFLLGLLREREGLTSDVVRELGLTYAAAERRILAVIKPRNAA